MSSKGGRNCQSTDPLDHHMISCFVQRKFMALDHHRVFSTFLYATISLLGLGLECEPAHFGAESLKFIVVALNVACTVSFAVFFFCFPILMSKHL